MPREGVVLDAGAFIELERRNAHVVALVRWMIRAHTPLVTSAGVVAQVWRGGARAQVPVASLLARAEVIALTDPVARAIGRLLAATHTSDPIDAHVVLLAQERDWPVLTSDPDDLLAIDPHLVVDPV